MLFFKKKPRSLLFIIGFIFLFLSFNSVIFAVVRDFVGSVKVLKVNSNKQTIIAFNKLLLEGEVDVWVDQKLHIWSDFVEIDKNKQSLVAYAKEGGRVIIEDNDFIIFVDRIFLDLDKKTGYANNLRVHVMEGYVKAKRAEKFADGSWQMEEIFYTPCDAPSAHWSISASKAKLYTNYIIKFSGVFFKFGKFPVLFLPSMVLPIQKRSKSGFLLPKFSFDDELGFGIREEYYCLLSPHMDSTMGIDWRDKKGVAFFDEFRWARAPEEYTLFNGSFALEKNAFIKRGNNIVKGTQKHYWIEGRDFRQFGQVPVLNWDLHTLLRLDFGTDKKIGYQFFDDVKGVDDTFYNSLILRTSNEEKQISLFFDFTNSSRKKFSDLSNQEVKALLKLLPADFKLETKKDVFSRKKETEDSLTTCIAPHLEFNKAYTNLKNFFTYRDDFFIDWTFSREKTIERYYINSKVVKQQTPTDMLKADTVRFFYKGDFLRRVKFKDQTLDFYVKPDFQVRSRLKDPKNITHKNVLEERCFSDGAYRLFLEYGAGWNFPEAFIEGGNNFYNYWFQPQLQWNFLPKINQNSWYFSDKYDRQYAKNRIDFSLKNDWSFENIQMMLKFNQGYDFYDSSDIYCLNRCPNQKHLSSLSADFDLNFDILQLFVSQEYNLKNSQLLQSEVAWNFDLSKFSLSLGLLYQHQSLQKVRELFSDIPHFVLFGISIPVSKNAILSYDGQFYSNKGSKLFPFEKLKPLIHAVKFEYNGHCWGVSLGFEEKRYKEYGNWKSEQAYTLFFKLDSLGSLTRKFKRPASYYYSK